MIKIKFILATLFLVATIQSYSQHERTTLGLGAGFDYGGFGGNLTVYPNKNVGLFAGVGYALAGVGVNGGIKLRAVSETSRVAPYFTAMYGYNSAVVISNASQYNKIFYAPTIGFGVDFFGRREKSGYWSLALMIPIRGSDVDSYLNDLRNQGIVIGSPSAVGLSIGYRFKLD